MRLRLFIELFVLLLLKALHGLIMLGSKRFDFAADVVKVILKFRKELKHAACHLWIMYLFWLLAWRRICLCLFISKVKWLFARWGSDKFLLFWMLLEQVKLSEVCSIGAKSVSYGYLQVSVVNWGKRLDLEKLVTLSEVYWRNSWPKLEVLAVSWHRELDLTGFEL